MFVSHFAATELEGLLADPRATVRVTGTATTAASGRTRRTGSLRHLGLLVASLTVGAVGITAAAGHDTDSAVASTHALAEIHVPTDAVAVPVTLSPDEVATTSASGSTAVALRQPATPDADRAGVLAELRHRFGAQGASTTPTTPPPAVDQTVAAGAACDAPLVAFHEAKTFDELMGAPAPIVLDADC